MAAVTRARGGREASIVSLLGSLSIVGPLLVWIAIDEGGTTLPRPQDAAWVIGLATAGTWAVLWLAVRGLSPWYGSAGFSAGIGLALAPRLIGDLGLALYFSLTMLGSAAGALIFDHYGVFGFAKRRVSVSRASGLALVAAGVVLVRVA